MRPAISTASSSVCAMPFSGCRKFNSRRTPAKRSRSSAKSIESKLVPNNGTPAVTKPRAKFSGVCPPNCTTTPTTPPERSGRSKPPPFNRSMALRVSSRVNGSKNNKSEVSKSVETVSGLELIITDSRPTSPAANEA